MTAKEVHGKERSIRSYVVKCFKDAFNDEEIGRASCRERV